MVRAHWSAMQRYMAFIERNNPAFRWTTYNRTYGDWLPAAADDPTGKTLIATAFWAADAAAMRDMARGLDDRAAEAHYAALYARIRSAFAHDYVTPNGQVGEQTVPPRGVEVTDTLPRRLASQTSYALALRHGLVPDSLRATAVDHLVANIAAHDGPSGDRIRGDVAPAAGAQCTRKGRCRLPTAAQRKRAVIAPHGEPGRDYHVGALGRRSRAIESVVQLALSH